MPSERGVASGGVTTSPEPITTPSVSRSSPTFALIVRTTSGSPSTTNVTVFWTATYPTASTMAAPVRAAFPTALRVRSLRTREGRTGMPTPPMKEGSGGKRPGPVPKPPRRARGPYQTLNLQGKLERPQVATGIALDQVGETASKVWKPLAKSGKKGERVGESRRPDLLDG